MSTHGDLMCVGEHPGTPDVVGMMMREPDRLDLELFPLQPLLKPALLVAVGAGRIDNNDAALPKHHAVGVGGRRQGRRSSR